MNKRCFLIAVAGSGIVLAAISTSRGAEQEENEQKITWKQVPAAAQKTLTREAFGASIATVDKEKVKGKDAYEADVKIDGHNYEIVVDGRGLLLHKALDEGNEKAEASEQKAGNSAKGDKEDKEDNDKK